MKEVFQNLRKAKELLPPQPIGIERMGSSLEVRIIIGYHTTNNLLNSGRYCFTEEVERVNGQTNYRYILVQDTLSAPIVRAIIIQDSKIERMMGFPDNLPKDVQERQARDFLEAFASCQKYQTISP